MNTKSLLFALLIFLPWYAQAQIQETIYRVYLTDLPDDLNMTDMGVSMVVHGENYVSNFGMYFDEETNSFYLSSDMYSELKGVTEAQISVNGSNFISTDTLEWQMKSGQTTQETSISLKSYRKVFFDIENGWNFYHVSSDEYFLDGFNIYKKSGSNYDSFRVGGGGYITTTPEHQEFYIYAEPGEYLFEGEISRLTDNISMRVEDHPFTIPNEGKAFIGLDWEHNTLLSFSLKNVAQNVEHFTVSIYDSPIAEEAGVIGTEIYGKNGKAHIFLPKNKEYHWVSHISSYNPKYLAKRGAVTVTGKEQFVYIDYSDFIKQTFVLKNIEDFSSANASVFLSQAGHQENSFRFDLNHENTSIDIYLPKDEYSIYAPFSASDHKSNSYSGYPFIYDISVDTEKEIYLDFALYHKVNFLCAEDPFYVQISKDPEENNIMIQGYNFLLQDGTYTASGNYQPGEVDLEKTFTVSGADTTVEFEYNPNDYTKLTIQVDNMSTLPAFINAYCFEVTLYQNEKEVDYQNIYESSQGYIISKKIKKGTYTYKGHIEKKQSDGLIIPCSGTLVLNDAEQTLKFDINDFCIVPLDVTDEHQNLLESLYFMLGDDSESIDNLEQPNAYIMAVPGIYPVTFFAARHENLTQNITVSKSTEKLSFSMKSADVFPLIVSLEDFDQNITATVTVEGVGSYQINGYEVIGNMLPFMSVKAGTYNLTVSAPGYETHTQVIEVNEANYNEDEEAVLYNIYMEKAENSVEDVLQNNIPVIKVYPNRIYVETQTDCRMMVYNMSGVSVASAQGKQMMTKALPSGIYIVRTVSTSGIHTKKVVIKNK